MGYVIARVARAAPAPQPTDQLARSATNRLQRFARPYNAVLLRSLSLRNRNETEDTVWQADRCLVCHEA